MLGVLTQSRPLRAVRARKPAGQEFQGVLRSRAGFGCVGQHALPGIAREREGLEEQVDVADHGVVDQLCSGGVDADVVGTPSRAELVAACGQLAD